MREAVGNSLVMGMVAAIIGVIMIFFVGSISYSKAYKVKNKIINIIEENNGWNTEKMEGNINSYLKEVGYQVGAGSRSSECQSSGRANETVVYKPENNNGYNYCVIKYCQSGQKNCYYKVITYMRFEFPIIGSILEFPVKGETKTFGYFDGNA